MLGMKNRPFKSPLITAQTTPGDEPLKKRLTPRSTILKPCTPNTTIDPQSTSRLSIIIPETPDCKPSKPTSKTPATARHSIAVPETPIESYRNTLKPIDECIIPETPAHSLYDFDEGNAEESAPKRTNKRKPKTPISGNKQKRPKSSLENLEKSIYEEKLKARFSSESHRMSAPLLDVSNVFEEAINELQEELMRDNAMTPKSALKDISLNDPLCTSTPYVEVSSREGVSVVEDHREGSRVPDLEDSCLQTGDESVMDVTHAVDLKPTLEVMGEKEGDESTSDSKILNGVVAFVDVRSGHENRSMSVVHQLEVLGATISTKLDKNVTHVVYKDGKPGTLPKALKLGLHVVSVLWVDSCRINKMMTGEHLFPAVLSKENSLFKTKRLRSLQPKSVSEPDRVDQSSNRSGASVKSRSTTGKKRKLTSVSANGSSTSIPEVSPRGGMGQKAIMENAFSGLFTVSEDSDSGSDDDVPDSQPIPNTPLAKRLYSKHKDSPVLVVRRKNSCQVTDDDSSGVKALNKSDCGPLRSRVARTRMSTSADKNLLKNRTARGTRLSSDKMSTTAPLPRTIGAKTPLAIPKRRGAKKHLNLTPTIVFTSYHTDERETAVKVVDELGGFEVVETVTSSTSHLVCSEPRRTVNVLLAMCRGCWVLSKNWITDSKNKNQWQNEEDYEVTTAFPSCKDYRLNKTVKLFAEAGLIYVSSRCNPTRNDLIELLVLSGAIVTSCLRKSAVVVGQLVVTRDGHSPPCVTEKWILDSITQRKILDYADYSISLGQPVRSGSPEL